MSDRPAREAGEEPEERGVGLSGAAPEPLQSPPAIHSRWIKYYLGDGAYVHFDGFGLLLTAEDGECVTDRIYLEPHVWYRLEEYVRSLGKGQ